MTPKILQRLQRRLHVGRRVVVVGLRRLEVALRDRLVLEQVLVAIEVALRQVEAVLRLAVGRDRVGDVGAAHVEQRDRRAFTLRAGVDEDARDRAAHLRDRLRRVVVVPVDRAGGAKHGRPRRLRDRAPPADAAAGRPAP